ncbi:TPA: PilZ domain-containing protein [Raoultella planticola]
MNYPYTLDNEFEIKAIIRNAVKYKTKTVLNQNYYYYKEITNIYHDGFCMFYINDFNDFTDDDLYEFELHEKNAKYEFISKLQKKEDLDDGFLLFFSFPKTLIINQNRSEKRIVFDKNQRFFCSGRFNNGSEYNFLIRDISHGGCALEVNDEFLAYSLINYKLRSSKLDFGKFGKLITNITVINVTLVHSVHDQNDVFYFHVSCQFKDITERVRNKLSSIILKLLTSNRQVIPNKKL